jgi:hypothetical protein
MFIRPYALLILAIFTIPTGATAQWRGNDSGMCPGGHWMPVPAPGGTTGMQCVQDQPAAPVQPPGCNRLAAQRQNDQRAHAPALNKSTGKWEARQGRNVVTPGGRKVWYQLLGYSGIPYVFLQNVGYVEMDDRYPTMIYPWLSSGDLAQIANAVDLIEGSAMMQCLMDMPTSDAD